MTLVSDLHQALGVSDFGPTKRRILAKALAVKPEPVVLADLRTNLRSVSPRIGFGDLIFNQVRNMPRVCLPDGRLNLALLRKLAEQEKTQRPVRCAEPDPPTGPTVELKAREAAIVHSLRRLGQLLREEFNWPEAVGIQTWLCHEVIRYYTRAYGTESRTLTKLRKLGIIRNQNRKIWNDYLWEILDVVVVSPDPPLAAMPVELLHAKTRHYLYHRRYDIKYAGLREVKIPKSSQ